MQINKSLTKSVFVVTNINVINSFVYIYFCDIFKLCEEVSDIWQWDLSDESEVEHEAR